MLQKMYKIGQVSKLLIIFSLLPWLVAVWLNWYVSETGVIHSNAPRDFARLILAISAGITSITLVLCVLWFYRLKIGFLQFIPYISCLLYLAWFYWLYFPIPK